MKPKLTIEFASEEDLKWAVQLITRAQEKVKADLPYSATPLQGGSAAILLSALGRSKKLTFRKPAEIDLSAFDSDEYDVEAMKIDARNGNYSPERSEEYRHENIVRASLVNGQFTQAKKQCASYGLNYEVELHKFKQNET